MQISVFGPLSIVRVLLHRYSQIIFSFSALSSNQHFLKWVFIININMTLLMNSFEFAKLDYFCFLANHDRCWALDHLYSFILLRFDWWHFICHLFESLLVFVTQEHLFWFYSLWVDDCVEHLLHLCLKWWLDKMENVMKNSLRRYSWNI